jgi:trk system potassium uptake protein TrkA
VKSVIVGCGRVGAELAEFLDRSGHDVIVVDTSTRAFDRLPGTFGGTAIRGDGTDEDTLRRAGAEDADIFLAMTEGDNRNVMAAQLAVEALGAKQVVAKVNDPLRAAAYADLGLAVLCRTTLMGDAVRRYLDLPVSGIPGVHAPSGQHPGGEHHDRAAGSDVAVTPSPAQAAPAAVAATPSSTATPEA